ncbi:MAG: UTRA domain-containing protein [Erysipelotrichaceae bacterium]
MDDKDVYVIKELDKYVSISEYLKNQHHSLCYVGLETKIIEANRWISKQLQIPLAAKVFSYRKLRIVDDVPKSIDHVYLPYEKVKGIEKLNLDDVSFYAVLKEHFGLQVNYNEEELMIGVPTEEEKTLLKLKDEEEVLITKGSTYINTKEPLEYFEVTSVTSFYRFRSVSKV